MPDNPQPPKAIRSRTGGVALIVPVLTGGALMLTGGTALAQSQTPGGMPPPAGMSLSKSAAMRFPQPVRVGDLLHRDVLEPVESQVLLGTVKNVVREPDGQIDVVVNYGGLLGIGARPIAVPVEAMVLVGDVMEIVAYKPWQLRHFPTFVPGRTTFVDPNETIKVGLAKPSH